jgi:hypothetical protein
LIFYAAQRFALAAASTHTANFKPCLLIVYPIAALMRTSRPLHALLGGYKLFQSHTEIGGRRFNPPVIFDILIYHTFMYA